MEYQQAAPAKESLGRVRVKRVEKLFDGYNLNNMFAPCRAAKFLMQLSPWAEDSRRRAIFTNGGVIALIAE